MKIMEIIGEAEGGMKGHYISLVKGLKAEGAKVITLCNFPKDDIRKLEAAGIQVKSFPFSRIIRPFLFLWKLMSLIYLIRMSDPHIIHCHGYKAGFLGRMAGWLSGMPITFVYTVHNFVTYGRGKIASWYIRLFEQWMGKKTQSIICVSKALKTSLNEDIGIPEGKLHVIYNAVPNWPPGDGKPIREKYKIGDKERVIGTVARLIPSKGIHVLLTAMSGVLFKYPNTKLLIVGSGPEENHLKKLSESLGIARQTVFAAKVSNVQDYYAAFDIFVLPTLSEGLGITILEAMTYELPIVATSVGGIPEWLTHEKNAILVPPNNVFAIRTALQSYLENAELAEKHGRQAKQDILARGISEEEMVKQTWLVLKEAAL
ncbi:MAG: glycosyltransferase [Clostridia bacterium]|nr:glycosyltransferase [Clostridia bacterium]